MFNPKKPLKRTEFIVLVATLSCLMALSTDAMLPAFPQMAADLGLSEYNYIQLTISLFMLGAGFGQLFFGPLADFAGRRVAILSGIVIFILGSLVSAFSTSFEMMILGRVIMGIGVAGPRTGSIALVRDQFSGREMAQVMSFVMMVFILVPAAAPALGQVVLLVSNWRGIFGLFIAVAIIAFFWMAIRQPETNTAEMREKFSWRGLARSVKTVLSNRQTMIFSAAAACSFGGFIAFLGTSQQIFVDIFEVGEAFPAYFAALALVMGGSALVNARIVIKVGMRRIVKTAFIAVTILSSLYVLILLIMPTAENLFAFMVWGMLVFFATGLLFGNINALAMEPMSKVAGVAAALIGAISTSLAVAVGIPIGQLYDGNILPIVAGFAVFSALGYLLMKLAGPAMPDP